MPFRAGSIREGEIQLASHDEEEAQIYYIPGNYDEGGGVLGGRIKTRNCAELVVLCGPLAYLEYKFLHFTLQTNIIIFACTLIPLAALCIFGIADESLSQILMAFIRFFTSIRLFSYTHFTSEAKDESGKFSLDKFLDSVSTSGWKNTMTKMREQNALKAEQQQKNDKGKGNGKKNKKNTKRKNKAMKKLTKEQQEELKYKENLRNQEKALGNQTKGWKKRAREVKELERISRGIK